VTRVDDSVNSQHALCLVSLYTSCLGYVWSVATKRIIYLSFYPNYVYFQTVHIGNSISLKVTIILLPYISVRRGSLFAMDWFGLLSERWPPGARTANGTALCHYVQLHRYFVRQSSEFCRHNPLCFFSMSVLLW
jgi:hypothetical protein